MKKCVIVLGMHRSGTSATAGAISSLGVNFGDNLFGPTDDNKKGFYENKELVMLNEEILSELDTSWDDPFTWEVISSINPNHIDRIKMTIQRELSFDLIGIKDPRMCLLLPLYSEALTDLGYEIEVLFIIRNPVDVAKSLQNRDNFPHEKSYYLWSKYACLAEKYSRNFRRYVFSYEELLENESVRSGIKEFIGCSSKIEMNFLTTALRNHTSSIDDLASDKNVPVLTKKLYKALLLDSGSQKTEAICDQLLDSSELFIAGFQLEKDIFNNNKRLSKELEILSSQINKQNTSYALLERELKKITNSKAYKILDNFYKAKTRIISKFRN